MRKFSIDVLAKMEKFHTVDVEANSLKDAIAEALRVAEEELTRDPVWIDSLDYYAFRVEEEINGEA